MASFKDALIVPCHAHDTTDAAHISIGDALEMFKSETEKKHDVTSSDQTLNDDHITELLTPLYFMLTEYWPQFGMMDKGSPKSFIDAMKPFINIKSEIENENDMNGGEFLEDEFE